MFPWRTRYTLSWVPVKLSRRRQALHYAVYLASDDAGTGRSQVSGLLAVGTNEVYIYIYIYIYTERERERERERYIDMCIYIYIYI